MGYGRLAARGHDRHFFSIVRISTDITLYVAVNLVWSTPNQCPIAPVNIMSGKEGTQSRMCNIMLRSH